MARIAEYGPLWRRLGWLVCFFYAAAAALRLARFNSRAATQDKHYFEGLPSPSAAAIVAALVWLASDQTNIGLPGLTLAFLVTASAGALMISRFAFNSFKQVNPGAIVRFTYIVLVPLAFRVHFLVPPAITLLLLFGGYALSAPAVWSTAGCAVVRGWHRTHEARAAPRLPHCPRSRGLGRTHPVTAHGGGSRGIIGGQVGCSTGGAGATGRAAACRGIRSAGAACGTWAACGARGTGGA